MSDALVIVDLLIVGGGPTGLFGAFYAGMRRMSVTILDSLEILGGQLTTLYPEKYIYDVAGFPRILARDLARLLVEQGLQYKPAVCLGAQVRELIFNESDKIYTVNTSRGTHAGRSILIAAGLGAFVARKVALAEAERYEGRGLSYFVTDLERFRGKRVLIVGGGDSAVDWANTIGPIAASATLIHRRDEFRAHEDSVKRMLGGPVRVMTYHELRAIEGDGHVERAIVYDNRSNADHALDVDEILVNVGYLNSLRPIKDWGLELEGSAIKVDSTMRTSRARIFAAGDIVTYPGKLKLIATGFAEACTAVNHAKAHIDPTARAFPGHSSEMKR